MAQETDILDWIRKGLEKPGRTQAGLAQALGVDRAQATRLLQGKRELKVRDLRAISQYLDSPPPPGALELASVAREGEDAATAVREAIEAIARGEMVVVTDDDDRENEGDLVMAAALATSEKMAFIIRHCCGIVCAPLTLSEARRLHLQPMVAANDAPLGTAFTVTVDVRHGLTTGISAEQRANTVRALANGNMGANDFVRPGHVFPLIAREGGVLMRSGHTEAAVDLCRLAGLPPVGVICELANDDGTSRDYSHSDVFLVGVSRSGKTPTCLYMAMQYGVFAANYPLTEDDLESSQLPPALAPHRARLYGLTISAERLQQIRH